MSKAEDKVVCLEQIRRDKAKPQPKRPEYYKQDLLLDEVVNVKVPNSIRRVPTRTKPLYEYFCPVKNGEVRVIVYSKLPIAELKGSDRIFRARVVRRYYVDRLSEVFIYLYPPKKIRETSKVMRVVSGLETGRHLARKVIRLHCPLEGNVIVTDDAYTADIIPIKKSNPKGE